jgi:hypothetical protein
MWKELCACQRGIDPSFTGGDGASSSATKPGKPGNGKAIVWFLVSDVTTGERLANQIHRGCSGYSAIWDDGRKRIRDDRNEWRTISKCSRHIFLAETLLKAQRRKLIVQTDYDVEHWTSACSAIGSTKDQAVEIKVNNRAATRQAIINLVRARGMNFVIRSDWAAHKNRSERMVEDWNYSKIAIHHAGRSFSCGPAALQLQEIQELQMGKSTAAMDDIGYHYALDCLGNVFEGRDIRFKGESVHNYIPG